MLNNKYFLGGVVVLAILLVGGWFMLAAGSQTQQHNSGSMQLNAGSLGSVVDGEEIILGNPDATVTIVEFSDLECGFCQRFHLETWDQLKETYIDTGKVRFEYKHFPLPIHPNAQKAAEAVECAAEQVADAKWDMIDRIFKGGYHNVNTYKQYASVMKLDTDQFNTCLDSGKYFDLVQAQMNEGRAAGVQGTPTFFINGQRLVGAQPFSAFQAAIEAQLN